MDEKVKELILNDYHRLNVNIERIFREGKNGRILDLDYISPTIDAREHLSMGSDDSEFQHLLRVRKVLETILFDHTDDQTKECWIPASILDKINAPKYLKDLIKSS